MASDYVVRTIKGYDFFEVSSAFQKSIRRGLEDDAMFWAIELYESNYAKYAWKRMVIMASEDVGLGDPDIISRIIALKQSYDYLASLKERSLPERLPFTQAVLQLVHAHKSRYVDIAICCYWDKHKKTMKEFPDYVFDMHTRKGKRMGRGDKFFWEHSAVINNANKLPNEDEMREWAMKIDGVFCDIEDEKIEIKDTTKQNRHEDNQLSLI